LKGKIMARRKKIKPAPPKEGVTVTNEAVINKRQVVRGTELSIKGVKGRFKFISHTSVELPDGSISEHISVLGGYGGIVLSRTFKPEQVKTVHRNKKLRLHPAGDTALPN
jgi:hypothetical protein